MAEDYAYINPETGQLYAVHGYPGYQYHIYQDGHVVRVNGPTTNETIAQYEAAHMPTATPVPVPVAAAPAPAPAPAAPPPPANTGGTAAPTPPSNTPDMKNYTPKWNPGAAATSSYVNPADHNDVFEIQNASYTPGHEGEWHVYKDRPPVWVAGNPSNMHYETLAQSQASQSGGAPTVVSVTPQPTTGGTAAPAPSNGTGGTAAPTTPPSNGTGGTAAPSNHNLPNQVSTGGVPGVKPAPGFSNSSFAQEGQSYTVSHGDTLSGIASSHGVSLSELEKANPQIKNYSLIFPNEKINIPTGGNSTGSSGGTSVATSGGGAPSAGSSGGAASGSHTEPPSASPHIPNTPTGHMRVPESSYSGPIIPPTGAAVNPSPHAPSAQSEANNILAHGSHGQYGTAIGLSGTAVEGFPKTSSYNASGVDTAKLAAEVKSELAGWGSEVSVSADPAKGVMTAVAKPDTDPLKINDKGPSHPA